MTLLEILIVVAIIALLMAMLLPCLAAARQQTRRLGCGANIRAVGMALQTYHSLHNHYPPRTTASGDPIPDPTKITALSNITKKVALELINVSLGDPKPLYCPVSLEDDPHAHAPFAPASTSATGKIINHWETGQISYIYLVGVRNPFLDEMGQPTFDPDRESPDDRHFHKATLIGDRTVEHAPGPPYIPGSNHGHEGGWFFFVGGNAKWCQWETLTAHPSRIYDWYWPRINEKPGTEF